MRLVPGLLGAGLIVSTCLGSVTARAQAAQDATTGATTLGQDRASRAWQQTGVASWYGARHAGRRTSSGSVFNPAELTAAHPTLPLGSRIRVTMQDTGASVIVTVTDRQPPHGRRIIDLSQGAAQRIGLAGRGTGMVTIATLGARLSGEDQAPVEVAEAPGAPGTDDSALDDVIDPAPLTATPHGRRHTRHAGRAVAAARPYYRVQSAALVRSSAPHRAARHRL